MRARGIKPNYYKDEDLVECSIWARAMCPGLWMMADRDGKLEDRPRRIKMEIYPCDDVDVDALLTELETVGRHLIRYEVEGKKYIKILEFKQHQNPHHKEKESVIPDPVEVKPVPDSGDNGSKPRQAPGKPQASTRQAKAGHVPVVLIPDSGFLIPDSSTSPNGDVGTERCRDPDEVPVLTIPLVDKTEYPIWMKDVEEWQEAYPGIKVLDHLQQIRQWNIARPKRRKTLSGIRAHIVKWLGDEQNKARGKYGDFDSGGKPGGRAPNEFDEFN
jgi:hypothetical protein